MNEEDSEQLSLLLAQMGFHPVARPQLARIILLNTCSVRKKPEDKAFSFLGELEPLKSAHPEVVIGVCGCMAQARSDEILRRAPHVSFVLGTGDLSQLTGLVQEAIHGQKRLKSVTLPERKGAVVEDVPQRQIPVRHKTKAFVPIQYGCDKFCTFCIVPTTRGRERSRAVDDVVDEVQALAKNGTKEITLLGQTVNSYGKNLPGGKFRFSELLTELQVVEGLERIRFMSPYPRDFSDDLIDTICSLSKVMEQCHMPLQAGHNDLLKRMHRVYTVESYLEIISKLRKQIPNVGITTDIIVGFPGETEQEFQATLDLVKQVRFYGAYCFAYSPRPGTPAATMEQVPASLKKERLNELLDVQNQITLDLNQAAIGKEFEVLIEGQSPKNREMMTGFSREGYNFCFHAGSSRIGRIVNVKATESYRWGLLGEINPN